MSSQSSCACGALLNSNDNFCECCGARRHQNPGAVPRAASETTTEPNHQASAVVGAAPASMRGIRTAIGGRRRSSAWAYYALLSILSLIVVFTGHAVGLVGFVGCGLYARYLYSGGRIVIWFW
jgi:hypothetical protein